MRKFFCEDGYSQDYRILEGFRNWLSKMNYDKQTLDHAIKELDNLLAEIFYFDPETAPITPAQRILLQELGVIE